MGMTEAECVATSFNDCINRRDVSGLSRLMTEDHVFIDAAGHAVSGKAQCIAAWKGFFAAFPDYRNIFEKMSLAGDGVVIVGRSVCSDPRLAGPALWTAKTTSGKVAQWRVYEDNAENRTLLNVMRKRS